MQRVEGRCGARGRQASKPGGSGGFWRPCLASRRRDRAGVLAPLATRCAGPAGRRRRARRASDVLPGPGPGCVPRVPDHRPGAGRLRRRTRSSASSAFHGRRGATLQRQLKRLRVRHDPGGGERRREQHRILVMPGVYEELDEPRACAGRLRGRLPAHRGRAVRADLRRAPAVPERAEPDRDPRRHERQPHLRREVQHPDRGHRLTRPDDVLIDGRAREAQHHPRRPRGRHLHQEPDVRVLGLQQHLRARDERLPHRQRRLRATAASTGSCRSPRDHGIYENCETYGNGDSGIYPGSGPRPPRPAGRARPRLRDRDPQLQLARQQHRVLGHGGQRHLVPQQPVPPQRDRRDDGLVRGRPPGHAAGHLEVDGQPDLLEQQEHLQRRPRRVLQAARRGPRPDGRVPDVPGAGRHRAS